jgi:NAD-dependent deacetylase
MDCKNTFTMDEIFQQIKKELPPHCSCGGLLRPDVVLFGESLPQEALNKAWHAAQTCDTFLVVGSSLLVYPAAQIPLIAKENNAVLVIINIDETPLDHKADLVIHKSASGVLSGIIQEDKG